jgi:hypothetical protein
VTFKLKYLGRCDSYQNVIKAVSFVSRHKALNCKDCTVEYKYEVVSKIFLTATTIYTAVVVARNSGANRPNCELRVLLRRFAAIA